MVKQKLNFSKYNESQKYIIKTKDLYVCVHALANQKYS